MEIYILWNQMQIMYDTDTVHTQTLLREFYTTYLLTFRPQYILLHKGYQLIQIQKRLTKKLCYR